MKKPWQYALISLTLLIVGGAVWFFVHAFRQHLDEIRQAHLTLHFGPLCLSIGLLGAAYLLITQAWRVALTDFAQRPLSFAASVPAVHLPGLAKYIPGKVWSYALQMLWLARHDFVPDVMLYANVVNVLTSLLVSAWFGTCLLLWQALMGRLQPIPRLLLVASVLGSLVASVAFVWLHRPVMALVNTLTQRLGWRTLRLQAARRSLLLRLQAYHVMIYTVFGLASFTLAAGVGAPLSLEALPGMIAAVTIADALGFLVLLAPGGLGVRESVMALMLSGVTDTTLALVLPIASRVASMGVEAVLGGLSVLLVYQTRLAPRAEVPAVAPPAASKPMLGV